MLICSPLYPICDLLHCRTSFYRSIHLLSAYQSGHLEPMVLFQAPEFEVITPGHILCTLVLRSYRPIPEVSRKKCASLLRGVEAIGFAEG